MGETEKNSGNVSDVVYVENLDKSKRNFDNILKKIYGNF